MLKKNSFFPILILVLCFAACIGKKDVPLASDIITGSPSLQAKGGNCQSPTNLSASSTYTLGQTLKPFTITWSAVPSVGNYIIKISDGMTIWTYNSATNSYFTPAIYSTNVPYTISVMSDCGNGNLSPAIAIQAIITGGPIVVIDDNLDIASPNLLRTECENKDNCNLPNQSQLFNASGRCEGLCSTGVSVNGLEPNYIAYIKVIEEGNCTSAQDTKWRIVPITNENTLFTPDGSITTIGGLSTGTTYKYHFYKNLSYMMTPGIPKYNPVCYGEETIQQ